MVNLFVLDTNAIISYFNRIFNKGSSISESSLQIIEKAFFYENEVKISIPSIIFIEIFDKFCLNEELTKKIRYEIYLPIKEKENFEIRELDKEIIEHSLKLDDSIVNLESHDKIVLASALTLSCRLITSDKKIIKYIKKTKCLSNFLD